DRWTTSMFRGTTCPCWRTKPRARPRPWSTPSVVLHSPDHGRASACHQTVFSDGRALGHQRKEGRRQRHHGALVAHHEDTSAETKDKDESPVTEARNHLGACCPNSSQR